MATTDFLLTLADGTRLVIYAGDEQAAGVVIFFAEVACLSPAPTPLPPATHRLLVVSKGCLNSSSNLPGFDAVCVLDPPKMEQSNRRRVAELEPVTEEQRFWRRLARLSGAISRATLPRGGVLLHSALATCFPFPVHCDEDLGTEEGSVLLAGPSGVGKSTASTSLPLPWHALADDITLVVRLAGDAQSDNPFWAHPWPTWSQFFGAEKSDADRKWDVQRAVPLRAIFFLERGKEDRSEPAGPGEAVCRLLEHAQQASRLLQLGWTLEESSSFNNQRFENLCDLAKTVPAFRLQVKLNSSFWEKMNEALCSLV